METGVHLVNGLHFMGCPYDRVGAWNRVHIISEVLVSDKRQVVSKPMPAIRSHTSSLRRQDGQNVEAINGGINLSS